MNYTVEERELIYKCAYDLRAVDIQRLLLDCGYKRTLESITKVINRKIEIDKEKRRLQNKMRADRDIVKYRAKSLLNAAKSRASKKGLECSLTLEWVHKKLKYGVCAATGTPFVFTQYGECKETKKCNPYAPSLDKIDPSKGYTVENTQVVLAAFNKFKSDMVQHKVIGIAKSIVKYHMSTRQFAVNA